MILPKASSKIAHTSSGNGAPPVLTMDWPRGVVAPAPDATSVVVVVVVETNEEATVVVALTVVVVAPPVVVVAAPVVVVAAPVVVVTTVGLPTAQAIPSGTSVVLE